MMREGARRGGIRRSATLLTVALLLGAGTVRAQVKIMPVNGIWSEDSTADIGKTFGVKPLEGVKVRGWVSTYYDHRLGNPAAATTIGGRVFDTHNESFAVEQAKVEIEKVPEKGGAGAKVDLGWGDAQDQIFNRVTNAQGAGAQSATERNLQHATVGYLADIGSGLRIDIGKMMSHIGNEYADSIKNLNFSHDLLYTFAIPYNQTGIRLNYVFNPNFTGEFYILNGWNTMFAPNRGKAISPSVQYTFGPFSGAVNYFAGLDTDAGTGQPAPPQGAGTAPAGSNSSWRQLWDLQALYMRDKVMAAAAFDYGNQRNVPDNRTAYSSIGPGGGFGPNTHNVSWYGFALYAGYQVNEKNQGVVRWDTYWDPSNYTTGQAQFVVVPSQQGPDRLVPSIATRFNSLTFTWNYKMTPHLLLRPEFRLDHANNRTSLYLDNHGRPVGDTATIAANAIFYF